MWTAIDVVRFVEVENDPCPPGLPTPPCPPGLPTPPCPPGPGPPVVLIGVKPGSFPHENVGVVAVGCKELLRKFDSNLTDVEVEFRESVVTRRFGPELIPAEDIP